MAAKRGLVVDDEPAVRELLITLLSRLGYHCEAAANAAEALTYLKETEYDFVITDMHMPEMNGNQLADRIRVYQPRVPILLITGDQPREVSSAIHSVLLKPFSFSQLRNAIAALSQVA